MLRRVVYVVASAYIYIACFGLLVVASDWLGGRKGESAVGDYSAGLWPLPPEQESLLASTAVTNPGKPPLRIIQTNLAAVHAGETLIKWPPPAKVVQTNLAAVHAGETLIKRPPPEGGADQSGSGACRRDADQTATACQGGAGQSGSGACRRDADQTATACQGGAGQSGSGACRRNADQTATAARWCRPTWQRCMPARR